MNARSAWKVSLVRRPSTRDPTAYRRYRQEIRFRPHHGAQRKTKPPRSPGGTGSAWARGDEITRSGGAAKAGKLVGEIERQPAVTIPDRFESAPDHFTSCRERIEIGGVVPLDPGGRISDSKMEAGRGAPGGSRSRRGAHRARCAAGRPLPGRQQPAEHRRVHWLYLPAQARQRSPADGLEHVRIAPLAADPPGRNSPSSSLPAAESAVRIVSAVPRPRPSGWRNQAW